MKLNRWDILQNVKLRIRDQEDEIDWMVSRPSKKELLMLEKYQIVKARLISLEDGNGNRRCPFLTSENAHFSCDIQEIKPESCLDFYCTRDRS